MQVGMALTPNSLARRKPGVQIPSPPPHNPQVRASPASSRRRSPHSGAALGPRTPMEGCSTSAWERLPKLVDRQSNPSLNDSVRQKAGWGTIRPGPAWWALPTGCCRAGRAGQPAQLPALLFQLPGAVLPSTATALERGTASASISTATSRFLPQVARHRLLQPLCAHRGGWLPWATERISGIGPGQADRHLDHPRLPGRLAVRSRTTPPNGGAVSQDRASNRALVVARRSRTVSNQAPGALQ
jgi:hypothetical protein